MTEVTLPEPPAAVPPALDACPELLRWLVDADAATQDPEARRLRQQRLAELRRDRVVRPAIYVGAGHLRPRGRGPGHDGRRAGLSRLPRNPGRRGQDRLHRTLLHGADRRYPVARPHAGLVASKLRPRKCRNSLDEVFAGRLPEAMILGQHRHATLTAWDDVPYLDEHPFFAPQTRWVLANCGLIDPAEIDEYIARGGYAALLEDPEGKDAGAGLRDGRGQRPPRPGRRRLSHRHEVEVRPQCRAVSRSI